MKKIEFAHKRMFKTKEGEIITMRSLITMKIHSSSVQLVECYENKQRYRVEDLEELNENVNLFNFKPLDIIP